MAVFEAPLPILNGFGVARTPFINSQNIFNMYIAYNAAEKKMFLAPISGKSDKIKFDNGNKIRATYTFNNLLFIVCSNIVYSINTAQQITTIGTIDTTSGYIGISNNINQLAIVDGVHVYIYTALTGIFQKVVDTPAPNLSVPPPQPFDITFKDGYFIVASNFENKVYISNLNDGTKWVDTTAEQQLIISLQSIPDKLAGCKVFGISLYIFGKYSSEIWTDSGGADFPFSKNTTVLIQHGIASPWTVQQGFGILAYLSNDRDGHPAIMVAIDGVNTIPAAISTPELEYAIQNLENPSDSDAILWRENGDIFYQINFVEGNKSFLYNFTTKKWTQISTNENNRDISATHAYFNNKHYIGAFNEPALYTLSHRNLTNNGTIIPRIIITSPLRSSNYKKIRLDEVQLKVLPGVGTLKTEEKNPIVYLYISRDGGLNFGNPHTAEVGEMSEYNKRLRWFDLGTAYDFVLKFEFWHPLPFYVDSGYALGFTEE